MKLGPHIKPTWRDFWHGLAYAIVCTAWVFLWTAITLNLIAAVKLYMGW